MKPQTIKNIGTGLIVFSTGSLLLLLLYLTGYFISVGFSHSFWEGMLYLLLILIVIGSFTGPIIFTYGVDREISDRRNR